MGKGEEENVNDAVTLLIPMSHVQNLANSLPRQMLR